MARLLTVSAEVSPKRPYEPPELYAIGSVRNVTLGDDGHHRYDGSDSAKRWSRHGDYWHWNRLHGDDDEVRGSSFS